jgi:hypothetical protein
MLEVVVLLEHGGFVDVIVRGNPMLAGVLGNLADVFGVVPADVDVEEPGSSTSSGYCGKTGSGKTSPITAGG